MSADPNGPHPVEGAFSRPRSATAASAARSRRRRVRRRRQERAQRAQRELRARADGAAHARRRRRLHAEGRHRGGARVHRLDDRPAARRAAASRSTPRIHDTGEKVVLGHVIRAGGGESDGEQVLDILARHPSTARFIATKLARRFVSDTPPPALVERVAARFRETDGDLREVTRDDPHVAGVPVGRARTRAKVKTPFEFVVSALRATGADVRTRGRSCATCSSSACRSTCASRRPATRTPPTRGSTPARSSAA